MAIISIIYFSGTGHTAILARAIEQGVASVNGASTQLIAINEDDIIKGRYKNEKVIAKLDKSDAIIFGTPTYSGGPSAQFKAFADAALPSWVAQRWKDKIDTGFTVSGTPSGDKFSTLQYLQTFAMQHGMIWIGPAEIPMQPNGINRLGTWVGAMAQSDRTATDPIPKEDLLSGEYFGKRVASFTVRLKSK